MLHLSRVYWLYQLYQGRQANEFQIQDSNSVRSDAQPCKKQNNAGYSWKHGSQRGNFLGHLSTSNYVIPECTNLYVYII